MIHRLAAAAVLCVVSLAMAGEDPAFFNLAARSRTRGPDGDVVAEKALRWEAKKTAVIVCDVWDKHWCAGANRRVEQIQETMGRVVESARARGALIIHAPSDCMDFYKDTPQRKLAQDAAKAANLPAGIGKWCTRIEGEPDLPVDASDGGCDCQPQCRQGKAWTKQNPAIRIAEGDAVSDRGAEIWNLMEKRGIENVMILGVHTNMCILGRPFGLRNLSRYGKHVVLVRDLTDTMYNPRMPPKVPHERGTELVVEHIERYVCPTVVAGDVVGK